MTNWNKFFFDAGQTLHTVSLSALLLLWNKLSCQHAGEEAAETPSRLQSARTFWVFLPGLLTETSIAPSAIWPVEELAVEPSDAAGRDKTRRWRRGGRGGFSRWLFHHRLGCRSSSSALHVKTLPTLFSPRRKLKTVHSITPPSYRDFLMRNINFSL